MQTNISFRLLPHSRTENYLDLFDLDLALAAVSTIVAGLVYGFARFGSGYVLIPVFSLIFGVRDAVAVIAIMATLGGIGMMINSAPDGWNGARSDSCALSPR